MHPTQLLALVLATPLLAAAAPQSVDHRPSPGAPAIPLSAAVKRAATRAPIDGGNDAREVAFDVDGSGAMWARGANYKMRCASGAVRLLPFLASHAPRDFEIELALRDVTLGGRSLACDIDAQPQRTDHTIAFERGCVRELYELDRRSLEQKLVFARLAGRGELRVNFDVTTELEPALTADGITFSNEFGKVVYGRATAIDGAGEALELATTLDGGLLSISVPAEFVARARMPLVIDPVIAVFGIEGSPAESFAPDLCFDATGTSVLYCWEEEYSASDHDVWADVYDIAGNPQYHGGWIDMTADYWARPRCANLGASNRFLVVAHVQSATTGYIEVWGRTRDVTTALISGQIKIAGTAAYDVLDPEVGGDPYPSSPSFWLVAYEHIYAWGSDHDIEARLVQSDGTLVAGTVYIDTSYYTYDSVPSVSKSNDSDAWNIAWQRASPAGGNDIFGARVDWDGTVSSATFPIAVNGFDDTSPSVSSSMTNSARYVVTFEEDFGSDHDIMAVALDVGQVVKSINMSSFDGAFWYQDQRQPSIDCDGTHFACSYSELYGTSFDDYDVYVSELLFNGASLSVTESHQAIAYGYGAEIESQVAAVESGNPSSTSHDYAVTWHREPDYYNFVSNDTLGGEYQGSSGGLVASFCDGASVFCPCGNGSSTTGGCPNSAHSDGAYLTWVGTPSTSNDALQLFCGGVPANVTCLFFQGAHPINGIHGVLSGDGVRCAGTPMIRLATKQASATGGSLYPALGDAPLSIQGQIAPAGSTVVYQVWYRNPASFCTPSTTNFSNALVVAWTP